MCLEFCIYVYAVFWSKASTSLIFYFLHTEVTASTQPKDRATECFYVKHLNMANILFTFVSTTVTIKIKLLLIYTFIYNFFLPLYQDRLNSCFKSRMITVFLCITNKNKCKQKFTGLLILILFQAIIWTFSTKSFTEQIHWYTRLFLGSLTFWWTSQFLCGTKALNVKLQFTLM